MATNTAIRNAVAITMLDLLVDALDAGGGPATIEVRTGAPPAATTDADSGTLLATLTCSTTAFGAAANDAGNHRAKAIAAAITSDTSADATGTGAHFRAKTTGGVVIIQGTVGTASADMILNTVSIAAGDTVACTSWIVYMPDGSD